MFVTSVAYSGAVGSLSAADMQCQHQADAHGVPGVFHAWLSDRTTDAYARMTDGPWYTTGDALAFATKSDLRGAPRADLRDELGDYPQARAAWSGSDANGVRDGRDCDGWTNATAAATGMTGSALGLDAAWGGDHAVAPCDGKAALVCFQQ